MRETGLCMCEEEDRIDMYIHWLEKGKCFPLKDTERLHENEHCKYSVIVVTLGKKPCHQITAAAAFLSQSMTISSTIHLGLITERRLDQLVTFISDYSFPVGGWRSFWNHCCRLLMNIFLFKLTFSFFKKRTAHAALFHHRSVNTVRLVRFRIVK